MSGHGFCPDRTSDVNVPMDTTFAEMHLINEKIREGLRTANFIIPSPVQRKAIPRTLCGYDTIFKAKSGTGKTAVFAITALQSILELETNQPQVLILAPTREIAVQIVGVIRTIGASIAGLKIEYFIGGTNLQDDVEKLKNCRIVVGAPGRIAHLIELEYLNTKSIRLFIVDEADQLLQSSFHKDFNFIFNSLPESKQALICSATFTLEQINFLHKYMTTFSFVSGDEEDDCADQNISFTSLVGVKQFVSTIPEGFTYSSVALFVTKLGRLLDLLKTTTFSQCLVFTNYITRVKTLSNKLTEGGFPASFLCSEQEQSERIQALKNLKEGGCRVLVCTDLAARGIDAQNVNLVINFEVPIDQQTYLHRMGRAGRYGSFGIVVTLAAEGDEIKKLQIILGAIKAIVSVLPTEPPFIDAMDKKKIKNLALKEISGLAPEKPISDSSITDSTAFVGNVPNNGYFSDRFESNSTFSSESKENICPRASAKDKKSYTDQSYLQRPLPAGCNVANYSKAKGKKKESWTKAESTQESQNQRPSSASSLVLDSTFLGKIYTVDNRKAGSTVDFVKDVDCTVIKSTIEKDFAVIGRKSREFCSKLQPHLVALSLLNSNYSSFLSNIPTNESMKNYFLLCKHFKNMNQNIVNFVEKQLKNEEVKREDNFWKPNRTAAPRLPANLIKRKPEWAPKPDPPKPKNKYLYLRQDFLKRLYGASKINKDFCIENLKANIEPSFAHMWKVGKLTMANILKLSQLDLLQQPVKGLNSQSVEPYFQFCRHFIFLNPELVTTVSKKIHKIEAGLTAEEADKEKKTNVNFDEVRESKALSKTGVVEVSSAHKHELQTLTNLDTIEGARKKILEKLAANRDYILDLKRKAGSSLFVDQSFDDVTLLSYLKLCQTFKNFDVDFLTQVQPKLEKSSPSVNVIPSNNESSIACTSSEKTLSASSNDERVSNNSCTSTNLPTTCSTASKSEDCHENLRSLNYEELKQYPPCKAARNVACTTIDPKLSSSLQKAMSDLARSTEKDCVQFMTEGSVVPAIFNLLKSSHTLSPKDVKKFIKKHPVVTANATCNESKLETDSYQKVLQSLHNLNVPKSPVPSVVPAQDLSEEKKSSINAILQSHIENEKYVSFPSSVKPKDAVSLLYKNDGLPVVIQANQPIKSSCTNSSPQGKIVPSCVGEGTLNFQSPSTAVAGARSKHQTETIPREENSNGKTSSPQNDATMRRVSKRIVPVQPEMMLECESSDWVTASSANSSSDSEERDSNATMNLCENCKTYYKPAKSSKKIFKKKKAKRSSENHSNFSVPSANMDIPAPSYDQLLQWYNMWYQQVIFSQQFVWYNEYIRNMSSEK
nr:PREDICTED: uncharacterized protein LOC109038588 [Bemisia tabaci]